MGGTCSTHGRDKKCIQECRSEMFGERDLEINVSTVALIETFFEVVDWI
jgi:hypothetical protein